MYHPRGSISRYPLFPNGGRGDHLIRTCGAWGSTYMHWYYTLKLHRCAGGCCQVAGERWTVLVHPAIYVLYLGAKCTGDEYRVSPAKQVMFWLRGGDRDL